MVMKVLIVSMIIERFWEHLQLIFGDRLDARSKVLGSAVLAIAAALSLRIDLLYGLEVVPAMSTAGFIVTGLILGLGSNVVHDVIGLITGLGKKDVR